MQRDVAQAREPSARDSARARARASGGGGDDDGTSLICQSANIIYMALVCVCLSVLLAFRARFERSQRERPAICERLAQPLGNVAVAKRFAAATTLRRNGIFNSARPPLCSPSGLAAAARAINCAHANVNTHERALRNRVGEFRCGQTTTTTPSWPKLLYLSRERLLQSLAAR